MISAFNYLRASRHVRMELGKENASDPIKLAFGSKTDVRYAVEDLCPFKVGYNI